MKLVELGTVIKAHGLKGAFLVSAISGKQSALGTLQKLYLGFSKESSSVFSVNEAAWMPKGWKVHLDGIASEEGANLWRKAKVFTERESLPELESGEFYLEDLLGAPVIDSKSGREIGTFQGVEFPKEPSLPGTPDLWWVSLQTGGRFALPAVKKYILRADSSPVQIHVKNLDELELFL